MVRIFGYQTLQTADLVIDAIYEGAPGGQLSGEALSRLLPGVGNQGGFRPSGLGEDKRFVALYTSGEEQDWPDYLDPTTGRFLYFGDNKRPGHDLHSTQRNGNRILRRIFDLLHASPPQRSRIPPLFVFEQYRTSVSTRSFQFKGLAVPGFPGLPATEDLVAVWKTTEGQRFQNYRAIFTILDVAQTKRAWIDDLASGNTASPHAPEALNQWVMTGTYKPLLAERTTVVRSQESQLPVTQSRIEILATVWEYFKDSPNAFEAFAAQLFQWHDRRVIIDEVTRSSVDGGRDAVGRYLMGLDDDPVYAEFSLEAKCYRPPIKGQRANRVGVKEVSRLISRIRHREFGVIVTTSVIGRQVYQEVRRDGHPIIFISGGDIVNILTAVGFNSAGLVKEMLEANFPMSCEN